MSGLVNFFKDFLPNVHNIDYDRQLEDLTPDELQTTCRSRSRKTPQKNNRLRPVRSYPGRSSRVGELEPHPTRALLTSPFRLDEYTDGEMTFDECQWVNRRMLEYFWRHRYMTKDEYSKGGEAGEKEFSEGWDSNEDEDAEDSSLIDKHAENQEISDEMQLESQPVIPQNTNAQNEPWIARKPRIVPLFRAIHSIGTIDFLDLTTKAISLDLCRVTKVWRLREIKRGMTYMSSTNAKYNQRCFTYLGRIPRTVFGYLEDDGPLKCSYDDVLTLEVEQLNPLTKFSQHSLRIFFYNSYARALSTWMEERSVAPQSKEKREQMILRLSNIPGKCIIPHAIDLRNWWNKEHVHHYSICVGDEGRMPLPAGSHIDNFRLDDADMEIWLTKTSIDPTPELYLTQKQVQEGIDNSEVIPRQSDLLLAWKTFTQGQIHRPESPNSVVHREIPHASVLQSTNDNRLSLLKLKKNEKPVPIQRPGPASTDTWEARIRANRPSPPPAVNHNVEPMVFKGEANRLLLSKSHPRDSAPLSYSSLASLSKFLEQLHEQRPSRKFRVNIYGVVLAFTLPSMTKRGQWMWQCILVDESTTVPVPIIIFRKERDGFPRVAKMGDVLRLHRVTVGAWNGEVQITGFVETSAVVVRHNNAGDCNWVVVPSASKEYTFNKADEQRSQNLWRWGQILICEQPTMMLQEHAFSIGAMSLDNAKRAKDLDLTVMVTAKIPFPRLQMDSTIPYGILRIWDGTGNASSDPLPIPHNLVTEGILRNGDPTPEAITRLGLVVETLKKSKYPDLPQNKAIEALQIPESACGKVVNAIVWEKHHWDFVQEEVIVGSFIRLRNVEIQPFETNKFQSVAIHFKTWLSPLPDTNYEIRNILLHHNDRVKRKEFNPSSALLPKSISLAKSAVHISDEPNLHEMKLASNKSRLGRGLEYFVSNYRARMLNPAKRLKLGSKFRGVIQLLPQTEPEFNGNLSAFCTFPAGSTTPTFQLLITVTDDSHTKLQVIVNGKVGNNLFGCTAEEASRQGRREFPFDFHAGWNVLIYRVIVENKQVFFLRSIEKVI